MRVILPALTMSAFLALQAAADSRIIANLVQLPKLPAIPSRFHMPGAPGFTLDEVIRAVSLKHKVPPAMVRGVMATESDFKQGAVSNKGAIGLMQLMPATAEELGADPKIAEQNIEAGTKYLRFLLDRYKTKRDCTTRAIAAYNAGPGNVDRYDGVPPFPETQDYVKRVLANCKRFATQLRGSHEEWAMASSD